MDFKVLESKTKILFLLTIIFLFITLATLITWTFSVGNIHILFLLLTVWFASTSSLIFHYLLWKNLNFLQNVDWNNTSNFGFILAIGSYIILFPIICILTIAFLFIFSSIVFVLIIVNVIKNRKNKNVVKY
ncbi:hypothetical protein [Spiroplasma sp. AdecLV25b]|uniref:hypothetical protein n=1 Tax=Spiroplasma sp. AdecLV25b TaxID=3027162 RepID=UPI0027DFB33C|nr:hypothetical protein [Spiroplasma sp. AdecLV25b]